MPRQKKPRGRPVRPMPDQIPDTPENVARSMKRDPSRPANDWEYLREHRRKLDESQADSDSEE